MLVESLVFRVRWTMAAVVLCLPGLSLASDAAWNGGKEDIVDMAPEPEEDCTGNCPCPKRCNTSSPVYTARGYLVWAEKDVEFRTGTEISLVRTYNSFDMRAGLFGRGWMTAQESSIARTYKAVNEAASDGSPSSATDFESSPLWTASYGRRYALSEDETGATPPKVLYFKFEKHGQGGFKQVFDDSRNYNIYNKTGALVESYSDTHGVTTYYDYDDTGRLTEQVDGHGFGLRFVYNEQGFVDQAVDQANRTWSYSYDEQGNLTERVDPDGGHRTYEYETVDRTGYKEHALTSVQDAAGQVSLKVTYKDKTLYDKKALRVSTYATHKGLLHSYEYGETTYNDAPAVSVVKTTERVDVSQVVEKNTYIADPTTYSILKETNNTRLISMERTFNDRGRPVEVRGHRGEVTRYEYNEAGRVTKTIEHAGTDDEREINIQYYNNTNRIEVFNEYGLREMHYTYDSDLRVQTVAQRDLMLNTERVTRYTYHPNTQDARGGPVLGKLASVDGPREGDQDVQRLEYDARGLRTRLVRPLGATMELRYNAAAQLSSVTAPNGLTTQTEYDYANRITKRTLGDRTTAFGYDSHGRITKAVDELGRTTTRSYNIHNHLERVSYASGDYLSFVYTHGSAHTEVNGTYFDAEGTAVRTQRSRFHPVRKHTINEYQDGRGTLLSLHLYNSVGDLTSASHYGGSTYTYHLTYDADGRIKQVSDPFAAKTEITRDLLGGLVELTFPNGATTRNRFSAWGELLRSESPDYGVTEYGYDGSGNMTSHKDANGKQTFYAYDALERPVSVDYEGESFDVTLNYDESPEANGLVTSIVDGSGSERFEFDTEGMMTRRHMDVAGVSLSVGYGYDLSGAVTEIVYPSGTPIVFRYDDAGRLSGVDRGRGPTAAPILHDVSWHGPSVGRYTLGNGSTTEFSYDMAGRLTQKRFDEERMFRWVIDKHGNVTHRSEWWSGTVAQDRFRYDRMNRLTWDGVRLTDYNYDSAGNRTDQTRLAKAESFTYEPNTNRLVERSGVSIQRDAVGNTLNDGVREYEYSPMNLLTRVARSDTGVQAHYTYNYNAQRVRKQVDGAWSADIRYVYDSRGALLGEYDGTGARIREYVYWKQGSSDEPIAQINADGSLIYLHTDHNQAVRFATDEAQRGVWRWTPGMFGVGSVDEDPDQDETLTEVGLRFHAQYFDAESGLRYEHARYYNPSTGRYVNSDPNLMDRGPTSFQYGDSTRQVLPHLEPGQRYKFWIDGRWVEMCFGCYNGDRTFFEHLYRNLLNRCPSAPPAFNGSGRLTDCKGNPWVRDHPDSTRHYHGGPDGTNVSYRRRDPRSPYGGFQCVYTSEGSLVTDDRYRGTYDYVHPSGVWDMYRHYAHDVEPHDRGAHGRAYVDPDPTKIDDCLCESQ